MQKTVEIISQGECVEVTAQQLDEIRSQKVGWLIYCQRRLTMTHEEAIADLIKYRHPA